jgi:L-lactate dehydrogenase (cytochrome)
LSWPEGDLALARAAVAADIPFVLSIAATSAIEKIAEAAPDHTWFQLYVPRDLAVCEDLLRRAGDAGMRGLMVTVDVPLPSKRERDLRNGLLQHSLKLNAALALDLLSRPSWSLQMLRHGQPRFENFAAYVGPKASAADLTAYLAAQIVQPLDWDDIAWLREKWRGPPARRGAGTYRGAAGDPRGRGRRFRSYVGQWRTPGIGRGQGHRPRRRFRFRRPGHALRRVGGG